MTATQNLTQTQTTVLTLAAGRPDGDIEPLPPALRGGARKKVIEGLMTRGLVLDHNGNYLLTDAGYAAVGRKRPKAETNPEPTRRCRENSKQATVIRMLEQTEGTTIAQVIAATGWQAHTVRGTFAGTLKKKHGLNIVSEKAEAGERIYRII